MEPTPDATSKSSPLSRTLKLCLFATGCAAIVTEYTLATLASYLLGNAIFQWTAVISLMLFAMGLGSRMSRKLIGFLLDRYVITEICLSLLCAFSAIFCYWVSAYTQNTNLIIYAVSCLVGFFIGLEIPLITRINDDYEPLRVNISSVMEFDFYGALAGGGLFAFVLLPFLGLTYTPILLGALNLAVATLILWKFSNLLKWPKSLRRAFAASLAVIILAGAVAKPIVLFGEQSKYKDKIVYEEQTRYQKIVITQWKDDYWLFLNGGTQFSTYDEERYHEPLVHPALSLVQEREDVLVLGGGDGLAARELLKYPDVKRITLVDLDPAMTHLAQTHEILLATNRGALNDPRVTVVNQDAYKFVRENSRLYDAIVVDLPDPKTAALSLLYSVGFYKTLKKHLKPFGAVVTQSASPLYAPEAFLCIKQSLQAAGFSVLPYQNSIPTMGRWGWNLGVRSEYMNPEKLKEAAVGLEFKNLETLFINRDAMISMAHFGKGLFEREDEIEPNTEFNHALMKYYRQGRWEVY